MNVVAFTRRLDRLAGAVPVGCPTCQGWFGVALCNADDEDDCHRPTTCPDCRRDVPITSKVVIVGVDWLVI